MGRAWIVPAVAGVLLPVAAWAGTAGGGAANGDAGRVQAALDAWLAERAEPEGVTGIAGYVSFGDGGPGIEAFAGRAGRADDAPPVGKDTLFAMGSTSKSFAAAIILKLEAAGLLTIDDTVGDWLPEYPAWGDVSIRRLLDMTSGIPNYSETEEMSRLWVEEPKRDLGAEELIAPLGLGQTFYSAGTYPPEVVARMAEGYFENTACADYQPPDCAESWNLPLIGRDVRGDSTSWAQAAGGAVASARDVDTWMRAVFSGEVVPPKQQAEWQELVSTRTGEPIADVSADDPQGFGLGLVKARMEPYGDIWFHQGTTLGFRTLYVWFEDDDLLVTVQTNSQPDDDESRLQAAATAIREAVLPAP